MKNLKRHLSVANVLSCMALFVALSGAAYAVSPIGKKAVKTQNLGNGAVTALKLRNGAVTALKLRNGAVTTPKLRNLAVTGSKLGEASVSSTKLASGAVRAAALGGGVVTTAKLNNGAVATEKIANGAVTSSKLGADAVTTGKLQDGAVTAAKLAPSFLAQLIKNASYVTAASLSNTSEATKTVTATCPTGKQVVGGGAKVVGGNVLIAIAESAPTPAAAEGKRTGWTAAATESAVSGTNWSVEAFAVCAEF